MATLLDYRRRIRSVKSTQQITRAMKFVAAAKLRRAQEGVFAARPYAHEILRVLRSAAVRIESTAHPLFERRAEERILIVPLGGEFYKLSLRFGFAEDPNIPQALSKCANVGLPFDMMDTTFFLSRENIVADKKRPGMVLWRDKLFAFMARNAMPATAFFQIPGNRLIELGAQVEI